MFPKHSSIILLLAALALLTTSCVEGPFGLGNRNNGQEQEEVKSFSHRAGLFGPEVTRVTFEIDYEEGAEPYTTFGVLRPGNPFLLSEANIKAMFDAAGTSPEIVLPKQLDQMSQLPEDFAPQANYSARELVDLSELYRDTPATATERSFHILFLDGYFRDEDGERRNVLGVSIGDTGVIAMFKPVIDNNSLSVQFIEQTTLIHEFGHAAGLVNNGVDIVIDHHDEDHGAHCNNDDCVMYYLNEGSSGLADFVRQYVTEDNPVVFGEQCIKDIEAEGARLRAEAESKSE